MGQHSGFDGSAASMGHREWRDVDSRQESSNIRGPCPHHAPASWESGRAALTTLGHVFVLCFMILMPRSSCIPMFVYGSDTTQGRRTRKRHIPPHHTPHSPDTPTTGLRERGNDTSRSTGRSGGQKAATRRNMRREERVTVQGP